MPQATNRLAEAEPLMRRALAIDEQSYGPEHPHVAMCLNNLANVMRQVGELDEAEEYSVRSIQIKVRSLGKRHVRIAAHRSILCRILRARGRLDDALREITEAVAILVEFENATGARYQLADVIEQNFPETLRESGATDSEAERKLLSIRESP